MPAAPQWTPFNPPFQLACSLGIFPGSLEGNLVRQGGRPCAPPQLQPPRPGAAGDPPGVGARPGSSPPREATSGFAGVWEPPFLALRRARGHPETGGSGPPPPAFLLNLSPLRPQVCSQHCQPAAAEGLPAPAKETENLTASWVPPQCPVLGARTHCEPRVTSGRARTELGRASAC